MFIIIILYFTVCWLTDCCEIENDEATCYSQPPTNKYSDSVTVVHWFSETEFNIPRLLLNFPRLELIVCQHENDHKGLLCRNEYGLEYSMLVRVYGCKCNPQPKTKQHVGNQEERFSETIISSEHSSEKSSVYETMKESLSKKITLEPNTLPTVQNIQSTTSHTSVTATTTDEYKYRSAFAKCMDFLPDSLQILSIGLYIDILTPLFALVLFVAVFFIWLSVRLVHSFNEQRDYMIELMVKFSIVRQEIQNESNVLKVAQKLRSHFLARCTNTAVLLSFRRKDGAVNDHDDELEIPFPTPPPPLTEDEITEL